MRPRAFDLRSIPDARLASEVGVHALVDLREEVPDWLDRGAAFACRRIPPARWPSLRETTLQLGQSVTITSALSKVQCVCEREIAADAVERYHYTSALRPALHSKVSSVVKKMPAF